MGLTTYKATWIHVLFCLIWPALTQTINDLINEVKSSSAYSDIRSSICAQCALAGSNHTGCWGQGNLGSGAGQSPCPSGNATCFCDTANQEEVVNLIRDESYRLHQEGCPDRPETAFALAFSGYREFCAQHNQEVPATLSRTSDSTGTASSPSSNSSKASDPNPPGGGLGKGEIAGIAVGSAFGIGILILVIALFKRRRDRNPGSGPVSSRWLGLTRLTANERRDDQFSFK